MENKMKILQAIDVYLPDTDGVINCVNNYSLNLVEKSEVTVMCPKNKKGYEDNFPYNTIRCKSLHIPILNQYYGLPKLDFKFKKELENSDFDIVHLHSPFGMAKQAIKIARKKHIPVVATFHSNMRQIFESIFHSKFIADKICKQFGRIYNKCDEVFVCSPKVEEQLRSYGYNKKVTYIPFGTDFNKCETIEENSKLANEQFGIKEKELVFIFVGRVMKLKRVDFILDALKIVKNNSINFKFYIVGKGAELNKLKKRAKKLEFTDEEVIFTGFLPREQFPLLFSRADILLFPSIYDNFGLVKVEGAAYETAGVFVKDTCAGFDISHGENGFLTDNTVEDFAATIIKAVKDYDRLKTIGKNAKDTLYINWKDCTDVLYDNYKRIIDEYKVKNDNQK